jgi:hypothetical protein
MNRLSAALLVIAGIIHLLPLPGVLGATSLQRLYGIGITDPALLVLMQHRAVMFGLLGALLVVAAWRPELRLIACIAGLVSALSFIAIAWGHGNPSPAITRIVLADVVAVACLAGVALIELARRRA